MDKPVEAGIPDGCSDPAQGRNKCRVTSNLLKKVNCRKQVLHRNTAWEKQGHEGPFLPESRMGLVALFLQLAPERK